MPLPISGNQLNKLGKRLALPGPISDSDYGLLAQVAQHYQIVLDIVEAKLSRLGFQATTRVKTTGTLVDKLRRTPQLPLRSIHDVAGARIVIDGGRWEQDRATEAIMETFGDCPKAPELIDRRERPSHGYRAVHVIVFEDSTPVEIQIRTKMQDSWAQITERLGDIWGRGLRYGLGPDDPDAPAAEPDGPTRAQVIEALTALADEIDQMELAKLEIETLAASIDTLTASLAERTNLAQTSMDRVLAALGGLGGPR